MTDNNPIKLNRTQQAATTGIVHLGLGAFFRAFGAIYIKEAMDQAGGDWGVVGVSLRSPSVRDKLVSNDYLYTAVEVSEAGLKPQLVEVVNDVLVATEDPDALLQLMAAEQTRIVSLTVTEKGYCRGEGSALNLKHPDIIHDINNKHPRSAPGYLVRALQIRKTNGVRPFTVLSMDNLPANGRVTKQVVLDMAAQIDKELAQWIEAEGCFPSTMVDRIVPATTTEFITRLRQECGIYDEAAVNHEPFKQWVIEDNFVDNDRPDYAAAGAQLVDDVEPFEHMKLRMLNGTHSALAYVGSLAGHETVVEAITDSTISDFITALWVTEIAPSLHAPPSTNLAEYAATLKARYQNPEIRHLLEQIAMDGSQKLPQRILEPLFENVSNDRPYKKLLMVIGVWFKFLQARALDSKNAAIDDPMAKDLEAAIINSINTTQIVTNLLGIQAIFGQYPTHTIKQELVTVLDDLDKDGLIKTLQGASK